MDLLLYQEENSVPLFYINREQKCRHALTNQTRPIIMATIIVTLYQRI